MKNLILICLLVAALALPALAGSTNSVGFTTFTFAASNVTSWATVTWKSDAVVTNLRVAVTTCTVVFETNPREFGWSYAGTATNWVKYTSVAGGSAITLRAGQLAGNYLRYTNSGAANASVSITLDP